jgi:probable HAF family extracellular repeat protein
MEIRLSLHIAKAAAVLAGVLAVSPFLVQAQSAGADTKKPKVIEYTMVRLGPGFARAINARGAIVGSTKASDGLWHAFVWADGKGMVDLGTYGVSSEAVDINSAGQVLGFTYASPYGSATIWTKGVPQLLTYWSYTLPMAIGERGDAVLTAPNGYRHNSPLFWSPSGGFVVPDVVRGYGVSVNSRGQVVGISGMSTPMRWDTKTNVVTNVAPLCGGGAAAINDEGHVAGWCNDRAFRWTERNGLVTLPVPSADYPSSKATSINAAGWIAGTAIDRDGLSEAVLWDPHNRLVELGRPAPGTAVIDVIALNDLNLVVGNYREIGSSVAHPFLAGRGVDFIDLSDGGFQLPRWSMGLGYTGGAPLPRPLNNVLQIIGSAGPDAVLLQPSAVKDKK